MKTWLTYLLTLIILGQFNTSIYAFKVTKIDNVPTPNEIAIFDEKGEKCFLEQFEGKAVLLVFWATWCSTCVKEMPELDWLQKDFRKLPFEVLTVSQDFQGINILKEFFKTHELKHLKIYRDHQNQLFKAFSVVGLPTSFLINSQGKIVMTFTGIINWYDQSIRDVLLSHIPGKPEMPKNSYKAQDLNRSVKSNNINNSNNDAQNTKDKNTENIPNLEKTKIEENLELLEEKNDKIEMQNNEDNNDIENK